MFCANGHTMQKFLVMLPQFGREQSNRAYGNFTKYHGVHGIRLCWTPPSTSPEGAWGARKEPSGVARIAPVASVTVTIFQGGTDWCHLSLKQNRVSWTDSTRLTNPRADIVVLLHIQSLREEIERSRRPFPHQSTESSAPQIPRTCRHITSNTKHTRTVIKRRPVQDPGMPSHSQSQRWLP